MSYFVDSTWTETSASVKSNRTLYFGRPVTSFITLTSSSDRCDVEDFIALTTYRFLGEGHSPIQWMSLLSHVNSSQSFCKMVPIKEAYRYAKLLRDVDISIGNELGENSWESSQRLCNLIDCGLVVVFFNNFGRWVVLSTVCRNLLYSSSRNLTWWEDTGFDNDNWRLIKCRLWIKDQSCSVKTWIVRRFDGWNLVIN
jgi:hypothetical protein